MQIFSFRPSGQSAGLAALFAALLLCSCGSPLTGPLDAGPGAADSGPDAGSLDSGPGDAGQDAGVVGRLPAPANRLRYGVVSHPRDAAGAESPLYQVFSVGLAGQILGTDFSFNLGRSFEGEIVFTPDGALGFVPQIDGSIGVFRLATDGTPTVLNAALTGPYASQIVMGPKGLHAYAVDFNWERNGGGLYELSIGADDSVSVSGRILEGRSLGRMVLLDEGRLGLVAGRGVGGSLDSSSLFLLDLVSSPPALLAAVDLFGDSDAIVSSMAFAPLPTPAGSQPAGFVLVGDNNSFSGTGNRVGVARLQGGALQALSVLPQQPNPTGLTLIEDPNAIFASPFGGRVLVLSGTGDAALSVSYDAASDLGGFALEEVLKGPDPGPALPFGATMIRRGTLAGLVLVAELQHIRRYQFETNGGLSDLGRTGILTNGVGLTNGAIGVQP